MVTFMNYDIGCFRVNMILFAY